MMTIVQLLNGYQSHFGTNPCKFQIRLFQRSLETAWYGWFEKTCWFRSILINFGEYSMREWTNLNKIVKAIGTNWCKFKRHDQNIPKCSCHLAVSQTSKKVQQRLAPHIISQYILMISPYIPIKWFFIGWIPDLSGFTLHFGAIHLFIVSTPPLNLLNPDRLGLNHVSCYS